MRVEAERAEVVAEAEVVAPEEVVYAAVLEERGTLRGRERGDPLRGGEEVVRRGGVVVRAEVRLVERGVAPSQPLQVADRREPGDGGVAGRRLPFRRRLLGVIRIGAAAILGGALTAAVLLAVLR